MSKRLSWGLIIFFTSLLLSSFLFAGKGSAGSVITNGKSHYLSNTVVIKLKQSAQGSLLKTAQIASVLQQRFKSFNISSVNETFKVKDPANKFIRDIVTVKYDADRDPLLVASEMQNSGMVEWAEPHYMQRVDEVPSQTAFTPPNDPAYSIQWWLKKIHALEAWNLSSGDTTMIIGIVDTGVDWPHPDLSKNIWINRKEIPGNGIDDDGNGYVDDIRGWDFGGANGTPDNDPREDAPHHGTHVAGIASAVSDNGEGIASIGFRCKLMCVKVSREDMKNTSGTPYISYGYEGVTYAADNGAKVINCSWGDYVFSKLGQAASDYAASKGALVVAAAGNETSDQTFYPSGFPGVLSVASTDSTDRKSYFSNFGNTVKVCAPGELIYSTWQPGTYKYAMGTSMASPLVAGLAALVKSKFPGFTPQQVGEQIRVNSDNIDGSANPGLQYKLGGGRVNAFNALSNLNSRSVRIYDLRFSDEAPGGNGNGIFDPGETITLTAKFRNYLSPVSNLSITLQSNNPNATVVNSTFNAGTVATLDSFSNSTSKFTFTLSKLVPGNATINLLVKYTDNLSYNDFESFSVSVNPLYADQKAGNIVMTITSEGNLGFEDYPNNLKGSGFKYKEGPNLLFEGALVYGTAPTKVADAARILDTRDTSFKTVEPFVLRVPGARADYQGSAVFNDSRSPQDMLGIETKLTSFSYDTPPYDKFIILNYRMANKSGAAISNFYAGIFLDWDINADSSNRDVGAYDTKDNFGYQYSALNNPAVYAGCAVLSSQKYGFYPIQNDGSDNRINIYDGFTKEEKWKALSSGISKTQTVQSDISMVTSAGPFTINAGDSVTVAFVVAAGDNLEDLRNSILSSKIQYNRILTAVDNSENNTPAKYSLEQNYPNPFNPSTTITYQIPQDGFVSLNVYNLLGEKVAGLVNGIESKGIHKVSFDASLANKIASGIYLYKIEFDHQVISKKMLLVK